MGFRRSSRHCAAWDPFAGNLPQQLSSFVGRDQLLAEVADLVRSNRLVTLSGVGGVGKTRLALEVGAEMADEFPDGVWLVELAPVGDPSSVPAAIATALGITPQGDVELIDTVAEAVASRRLLLVVDNCEHVLEAAGAAIRQILGRSGNAKVLATSREYLWVADETLLIGLAAGARRWHRIRCGQVVRRAGQRGASRLRVVRHADRRCGDRDLRDPRRASARHRAGSGSHGGDERGRGQGSTRRSLPTVARSSERRPERQQTLQTRGGLVVRPVDEDERELLRNASVFSGGFDLAGISAVVEGADDVDVLERLDSLVRKSLVVVNHAATHTRYGMYETIRQFAEEQLSATGELERLRDRHAAHFGHEAAARRYQRWNGPGWRDAVDWVEIELGNLRSAFRWSVAAGRVGRSPPMSPRTPR